MITDDIGLSQVEIGAQNEVITEENIDYGISKLFQNARKVLEELESNVKHEKKQIVIDLAKYLEGWIQIDTICIEIVTQLRGQVSERFVRQCLDKKYKQKIRVENARKQERKNQLNDKEDFELAALTPQSHKINRSKVTTVFETENQMLLQKNGNSNNNSHSDMNTVIASGNTERLSINSSNPEPTKEYFKNKKCKRCEELLSDKFQLQEALEKTNLFIHANDMKKSNENKIIEFEIGIPRGELIEHIESISNCDSNDSIWITGSLDVNTGMASFNKCNKMREYTDYCQINSEKRND